MRGVAGNAGHGLGIAALHRACRPPQCHDAGRAAGRKEIQHTWRKPDILRERRRPSGGSVKLAIASPSIACFGRSLARSSAASAAPSHQFAPWSDRRTYGTVTGAQATTSS